MRRRLTALAGLAGAGVASTLMADALDRRRIKADPVWQRLQRIPDAEHRTVHGVGGTPLNVELYGPKDAPPIVLIHGWTCALRFWRLQVQDLMADHRIVAYDIRGHGDSGAPSDGDWSLNTLADDLDCVLDACVERPAVLGGHSLGAMTIAAWAGRHAGDIPEQAKAAVLMNTGLGDLISESLLLRMPDRLGSVRQAVGAAALGAGVPLPPRPDPVSHRAVRAIALSRAASPGAVRFSEEMVLRTHRAARSGAGRELSRLDLLEKARDLDIPTTVMFGDRDLLTPPPHAKRMAEAVPQLVELIELPESGHMGPLERPDEVSAALRAAAATSARPSSSAAAGAR